MPLRIAGGARKTPILNIRISMPSAEWATKKVAPSLNVASKGMAILREHAPTRDKKMDFNLVYYLCVDPFN